MGIDYVDGRRYGKAVIAGADWVLHTREQLNRLNVFPVPDGDTGTNMALSLAAAASSVRGAPERDLGVVARRVAEAGILGAKGNSGLMLAHWFLGISRSVGSEPRVDARGLAAALRAAAREVYGAVSDPVEGTILTVMREAGNAAHCVAERGHDVERVLDDVIGTAETSLAATPDLLPVLRRAGVVDAGAAGWVHFMKGVRRAIRGEGPPDYRLEDLGAQAAHPPADAADELTERYCTELVCRGRHFRADRLRRLFAPDGTHLLVATTGTVFKLHIHTNHPEAVFRKAERLGTLEERKVDDMLRQRDERAEPGDGDRDAQPSTVAIVTDSTCDLPESVRREAGIAVVPLQVLFGDSVFRDQVDLGTEEFYRRITAGEHPATSQPPPRAFLEALDRIRSDRPVVIVTLGASLSGTFASARSAARLAPHPRVAVVDSRSASVGLGMLALDAARLAAGGASVDEIVDALERARERITITFSVASLEHLRRGGRIGRLRAFVGSLLGVRPVLRFAQGRITAVARARSEEEAFGRVLDQVERDAPRGTRIRAGLIAAPDARHRLDDVERELRRRWDVTELLRGGITGVIGAHTGPGTWAVMVRPEEKEPAPGNPGRDRVRTPARRPGRRSP